MVQLLQDKTRRPVPGKNLVSDKEFRVMVQMWTHVNQISGSKHKHPNFSAVFTIICGLLNLYQQEKSNNSEQHFGNIMNFIDQNQRQRRRQCAHRRTCKQGRVRTPRTYTGRFINQPYEHCFLRRWLCDNRRVCWKSINQSRICFFFLGVCLVHFRNKVQRLSNTFDRIYGKRSLFCGNFFFLFLNCTWIH